MKNLNIGLIGYGFMGRTHSNAFLQAPRFFELPYLLKLKTGMKGEDWSCFLPRLPTRRQSGCCA
jgi:hypothetical protein